MMNRRDHLKLQKGSRIAVVGGGPAGSFFSHFVLEMARGLDLEIHLDVYEPRDFSQPGPRGCNMCGGIVSESLVQALAAEGIELGPDVVERAIDSYCLHMDVGNVRIEAPRSEKRIASVHRGGGPRGAKQLKAGGLDGYLLNQALRQGANCIRARVDSIAFHDGRPWIKAGDHESEYDLLVGAVGVNSPALKLFENLIPEYKAPTVSKAYISEFWFGRDLVRREFGYSMHVFLLDLPALEFAALIPKGDYVTLCMLGHNLDKQVIERFINSREVRQCMPPNWDPPEDFCHCAPKIVLNDAVHPFADRVVLVGDCGITRLYKDGIGSAYRTAKAAARTVACYGFSEDAFARHYSPTCRRIARDNAVGRFVFAMTRCAQRYRSMRRGIWRIISNEQRRPDAVPRISAALWDMFTGSAPYTRVLRNIAHPAFIARFVWQLTPANVKLPHFLGGLMQSSVPGRWFKDGEIICRQGELGDCLYAVERGQVELLRRDGTNEFCVRVLKEGDIWGEDGLLERDHQRSVTARCIGDACILTIERRMFMERLHEDPSLALKVMRTMSCRMKELEDALVRTGKPASTIAATRSGRGFGLGAD